MALRYGKLLRGQTMNIYARVSNQELNDLNMTDDELQADLTERLDGPLPELPGYNVFVEIEFEE